MRLIALLAIVCAMCFPAGCIGAEDERPRPLPERPNVLLIMVDDK